VKHFDFLYFFVLCAIRNLLIIFFFFVSSFSSETFDTNFSQRFIHTGSSSVSPVDISVNSLNCSNLFNLNALKIVSVLHTSLSSLSSNQSFFLYDNELCLIFLRFRINSFIIS